MINVTESLVLGADINSKQRFGNYSGLRLNSCHSSVRLIGIRYREVPHNLCPVSQLSPLYYPPRPKYLNLTF